jgi:hypothetical protein
LSIEYSFCVCVVRLIKNTGVFSFAGILWLYISIYRSSSL